MIKFRAWAFEKILYAPEPTHRLVRLLLKLLPKGRKRTLRESFMVWTLFMNGGKALTPGQIEWALAEMKTLGIK